MENYTSSFENGYRQYDGHTWKPRLKYFIFLWQTSSTVEEVSEKLTEGWIEWCGRDAKEWNKCTWLQSWDRNLPNTGSLQNRAHYWRNKGVALKKLPSLPPEEAPSIADLNKFALDCLGCLPKTSKKGEKKVKKV